MRTFDKLPGQTLEKNKTHAGWVWKSGLEDGFGYSIENLITSRVRASFKCFGSIEAAQEAMRAELRASEGRR